MNLFCKIQIIFVSLLKEKLKMSDLKMTHVDSSVIREIGIKENDFHTGIQQHIISG